jgi:IS5 family transposase
MEAAVTHRRIGQLGFVDAGVRARSPADKGALAKLSALLDWSAVEKLLAGVHASRRGEAAYPPAMMFKVLLLQRWYGLSDPEMEAALCDRLSFLRFCGLSLEDETPDHSTIWRFRAKLAELGLIDELFAAVGRQLDARGLLLKRGTLVDASLVTSAARRPRMKEPKVSPTDPEARFGASNERRRFVFGYKVHAAVDQGSGLVRSIAVTPANVQDVTMAAALLPPEAGVVYADRGYDSRRLREELARRGYGDGIMRKSQTNRPLTLAEEARNHALTAVRSNVERLFGTMKRSYRMARMRAFSMLRNRADVLMFAIAFNLRRAHAILAS